MRNLTYLFLYSVLLLVPTIAFSKASVCVNERNAFVEEPLCKPAGGRNMTRIIATHVKSPFSKYCNRVDLVYTWVNGSDPRHQKQQREFIPSEAFSDRDLKHRFRDFGEHASTLKFSLRSAEKFAPWIGHVWIVTASSDQIPAFLKKNHPKLSFVHHDSIFLDTRSSLPTFNSCAIEVNLHRIPGLADCFMYLNDDMLFTHPVKLEHYWDTSSDLQYAFTNDQDVPRSMRGQDAWGVKLYTVGRMIQRRTNMPRKGIQMVGHHGWFFQKHILGELTQLYRQEVEETAAQRWRSKKSVWMPLIYSNYLHWKFHSPRRKVRALYRGLTDSDVVDGGVQLRSDIDQLAVRNCWGSTGGEEVEVPEEQNGVEAGDPRGGTREEGTRKSHPAPQGALTSTRSKHEDISSQQPEGKLSTKAQRGCFGSKAYEWLCLNDILSTFTPKLENAIQESLEFLFPEPSSYENNR